MDLVRCHNVAFFYGCMQGSEARCHNVAFCYGCHTGLRSKGPQSRALLQLGCHAGLRSKGLDPYLPGDCQEAARDALGILRSASMRNPDFSSMGTPLRVILKPCLLSLAFPPLPAFLAEFTSESTTTTIPESQPQQWGLTRKSILWPNKT